MKIIKVTKENLHKYKEDIKRFLSGLREYEITVDEHSNGQHLIEAHINDYFIGMVMSSSIYYAVIEDDKTIGCFNLAFPKYYGEKGCLLSSFFLDPAYQNAENGSRVLNSIIEMVGAAGIKKISVNVIEGNHRAVKLYENFGFKTQSLNMMLEVSEDE